MTEIAAPINGPAQAFDVALKDLVNVGVTALESALHAWQPWTGLPVLKQLIDLILEHVASELEKAIALEGIFLIIKFETAIEKGKYLTAHEDYRKALLGGDQLLIKAAALAWADAASKFIKTDGSVHP